VNSSFFFGSQTMRIVQEHFFQFGICFLLIFLLDNIWVSLTLALTLFLYAFFNFSGHTYAMNVFMGCLLYYLADQFLDPKDISTVFKVLIGIALLNLFWICLQLANMDVLYRSVSTMERVTDPVGLMGIKVCVGMWFALMIPIVARYNIWATAICFWPIYLSQSSNAMLAGMIGLLFHVWFHSKRAFYVLLVATVLAGSAYTYQDSKANMMSNRVNLWLETTRDAMKHPLAGWGLDSFRNVSSVKDFLYFENPITNQIERGHYDKQNDRFILPFAFVEAGANVDPWDNPHNLFVSMLYEWGILSFVILAGIIFDIKRRFTPSNPDNLAICGFLGVLLLLGIGQFPMFLARIGYLAPIMYVLYRKTGEVL